MRRTAVLLALLPVLGLAELGLSQYLARRAPEPEAYARLAPRLLALKQPGMPVVVAPEWAEPLLRAAAPAAFPIGELTRAEDSSFAQFLEVGLLGQSAPELSAFPIVRSERVGSFTLNVRQNPHPELTVYDFVTAVDAGEVEVFDDDEGQLTPCPRSKAVASTGGLHGHVTYPRQRYDCGRGYFVAVSLIEDERYRPHRCVLAHLRPQGQVLLRFNGAPASSKLRGFAGFSYFLERDEQVSGAELSVSSAGRELGRHRVVGARGWQHFDLGAARNSVEVLVRRSSNSENDVCFALEAR